MTLHYHLSQKLFDSSPSCIAINLTICTIVSSENTCIHKPVKCLSSCQPYGVCGLQIHVRLQIPLPWLQTPSRDACQADEVISLTFQCYTQILELLIRDKLIHPVDFIVPRLSQIQHKRRKNGFSE